MPRDMQPQPSVLQMYLDETYQESPSGHTIVIGGWAAHRARIKLGSENLRALRRGARTPIVGRIAEFLEAVDGFALVTKATLGISVSRSGERDGTVDVSDMARRDNIWSHALIFTVAELLVKCVLIQQHGFRTVDVSYDSKSLTDAHQRALATTLRRVVARTVNRHVSKCAKISGRVKIRRIAQVRKAPGSRTPSDDQLGTWVADRLCAHWQAIETARTRRIAFRDSSLPATRTVQQWEGIRFDSWSTST